MLTDTLKPLRIDLDPKDAHFCTVKIAQVLFFGRQEENR